MNNLSNTCFYFWKIFEILQKNWRKRKKSRKPKFKLPPFEMCSTQTPQLTTHVETQDSTTINCFQRFSDKFFVFLSKIQQFSNFLQVIFYNGRWKWAIGTSRWPRNREKSNFIDFRQDFIEWAGAAAYSDRCAKCWACGKQKKLWKSTEMWKIAKKWMKKNENPKKSGTKHDFLYFLRDSIKFKADNC